MKIKLSFNLKILIATGVLLLLLVALVPTQRVTSVPHEAATPALIIVGFLMMTQVTEMGGIIAPLMPAFYGRPQTVDDIVNGTVGRILARLGLENELYHRWQGMRAAAQEDRRRPHTPQTA